MPDPGTILQEGWVPFLLEGLQGHNQRQDHRGEGHRRNAGAFRFHSVPRGQIGLQDHDGRRRACILAFSPELLVTHRQDSEVKIAKAEAEIVDTSRDAIPAMAQGPLRSGHAERGLSSR